MRGMEQYADFYVALPSPKRRLSADVSLLREICCFYDTPFSHLMKVAYDKILN